MKMKKDGFVSMALVYTFLVIFLFLMLAILRAYTEKDKFLDAINSQIDEDINKDKQNRSYILSKLLEDNTPQSYESVKLVKPASDSFGNGNGLFYISNKSLTDENNDGKSSRIYFFRGSVENNHLILGDMCFRIVRTNEDGSIRMIYDGPSVSNKCKELKNKPDVTIGKTSFSNSESISLVDVKDGKIPSYDETNTHSNIIDTLNNWYIKNIIEKNLSDYVSKNTLFCNNKKYLSTSSNTRYYQSKNLIPVFKDENDRDKYDLSKLKNSFSLVCSEKNDQFYVPDRTLSYPVGVLTADEILLAGGYLTNSGDKFKGGPDGIINKDYYLYTPKVFWTSTAFATDTLGNTNYMVAVHSNGYMEPKHVTEVGNVIPVISLKENIKITSGNGTANSPYRID